MLLYDLLHLGFRVAQLCVTFHTAIGKAGVLLLVSSKPSVSPISCSVKQHFGRAAPRPSQTPSCLMLLLLLVYNLGQESWKLFFPSVCLASTLSKLSEVTGRKSQNKKPTSLIMSSGEHQCLLLPHHVASRLMPTP